MSATFPPPVAAPERNRPAPALAAGALTAIVSALAYGALLRVLAHGNGSTTELGYGPVVAGALVGIAVGKAGGRNVLLPFAATLLTVLAVLFGGLLGTALIESHLVSRAGGTLSPGDLFFHHFGALWKTWQHDFGMQRFIGLLLGSSAAYGMARRFGDR
ncbi:MAG TPA: hypothetical protein VGL02_15670 [Streptomyces sp.]